MPITNGYTTLGALKSYMQSRGQTIDPDGTDDLFLESLVTTASRYIDNEVRRTFYARTETHYLTTPDDRGLWLDDDLLTITSLTNGDGTAVLAASYNLYPLNIYPKFEIRLKWSSNVYWLTTAAGESEAAITVAGTWGYSATAPADIATLTQAIAYNLYKSRFGDAAEGTATVTGAGVVITPKTIPSWGAEVLKSYRRLV